MKKQNKLSGLGLRLGLLVAIVGLTLGCEDVFENNISDKNISIVSPKQGDTIKTSQVGFNWKAIEGAEKYRLQINEGSKGIILDTLVATNLYTFSLESGDYSWRVRAENFAYKTDYIFPTSFRVEAIDDLSFQNIVLTSPSDKVYINNPAGVIVSWDKLRYADSYTLAIDRRKTGGTVTLDLVTGVTATTSVIDATYLTEDAEYIWKVKGVKGATETVFSSRSIFLDTKVPNTPVPSAPVSESKLKSGSVTFSWVNNTDVGAVQSPVQSVLEIATDEAFATLITKYEVGTNNQIHVFNSVGKYFWRVKNKDQASNESVYSEVRNFTIE